MLAFTGMDTFILDDDELLRSVVSKTVILQQRLYLQEMNVEVL